MDSGVEVRQQMEHVVVLQSFQLEDPQGSLFTEQDFHVAGLRDRSDNRRPVDAASVADARSQNFGGPQDRQAVVHGLDLSVSRAAYQQGSLHGCSFRYFLKAAYAINSRAKISSFGMFSNLKIRMVLGSL
jgi:hypothetical protein